MKPESAAFASIQSLRASDEYAKGLPVSRLQA